MALSEVQAGMRCSALSVIHGTEPSSFDVHVDDVVPARDVRNARILVTVSGPAVDATGVGPGFSGSPVSCPAPDGSSKVIGAISESIGAYGGYTVLVTPIQAILAEPVAGVGSALGRTSAGTRALLARARPLSEPLTISGLAPPLGRALSAAAARHGRVVLQSPAAPVPADPPAAPARLVPGGAMAAALATGDIDAGAIGTVTYVDGDDVWAFGHPLDGAGRRALFLTSAYVFGIIPSPLATADSATYKYAAPAAVVGTLSQDGISAVAGRMGAAPAGFPLAVRVHDLDTGRRSGLDSRLADERSIGEPTGASALSSIAPAAVLQGLYTALDGSPVRQSDTLCLRVSVREQRGPLAFCNRYVGGGGGIEALVAGRLAGDLGEAVSLIDSYPSMRLHVTGVRASETVSRGLALATLTGVQGPHVARRGSDTAVRLELRLPAGEKRTRTVTVHVPKGLPAGPRSLLLFGPGEDAGADGSIDLAALLGDGGGDGPPPPATIAELAKRFHAIERYDGLRSRFLPPGAPVPTNLPGGSEGVAQHARPVLRDPALRIGGEARLSLLVRP